MGNEVDGTAATAHLVEFHLTPVIPAEPSRAGGAMAVSRDLQRGGALVRLLGAAAAAHVVDCNVRQVAQALQQPVLVDLEARGMIGSD